MQKPPATRQEEFIYSMHGDKIKDYYHWLEESGSKKVVDWAKKQNDYFKAFVGEDTISRYEKIFEKKFDFIWRSTPKLVGEYWYFQERKPGEQRARILRSKSIYTNPILILNENELDDGISIVMQQPSPKGTYFAYETTKEGSEKTTIHIYDIVSKRHLVDKISVGRGGNVRWKQDESGFYYKQPDPKLVTKKQPDYFQRIYYHQLGDNTKNDEMIFGEGYSKEYSFGYTLSQDDKYLAIFATTGWQTSQTFILNTTTKAAIEVLKRDKSYKIPYIVQDKVIIHTLDGAPNGKIITSSIDDLAKGKEVWQTIIEQSKLANINICLPLKDFIVCSFVENVSSKLHIYDLEGQIEKVVSLPKFSSVGEIMVSPYCSILNYSFSNFVQSRTICSFDIFRDELTVLQKPFADLSKKLTVKQLNCTSKDGVKIPFFVVAPKNIKLDSNNPTLMYGYGGFGTSQLPHYNLYREEFFVKGGVYVLANIRGGGEFGKKWYTGGVKHNKIKSFEDFIAVAEYLIDKNYTQPSQLAIWGGSNGGLLTTAVMCLRPDLFGAVIAAVPLCDMYRFSQFLIASRWREEYGDPDILKDFKLISKWSPYENLNAKTTYPPLLLLPSINDTRVHPMHAWKMAAKLQKYHQPALVYTDLHSGHAGKTELKDDILAQARIWSFVNKTIMKNR